MLDVTTPQSSTRRHNSGERRSLSIASPLNLSHGDPQYAFLYQGFLKGVTTPAGADSPNLGVQVLAVQSGGLVLNKSRDLPAQINRCLADGSSFYEVTFDAATGDGLGVYHSMDVTVDRPEATARTNSAYYAGQVQSTAGSLKIGVAALASHASSATLRTRTRLVLLDVTVLDTKGLPIQGLKPDDFQLTDDGHTQVVTRLEEHTGMRGEPLPTVQPAALGDTLISSNRPRSAGIWNVVAVDLINTPKEERGNLQGQLEAFAKQIPPGAQVALVAMAGEIKVLSSFMDGQAGFVRALKKGLGPINVGAPANINERGEVAESIDVNHPESLQHKADVDVERQAQRAQMTLDDFSSMGNWLKTYPGKKNVFWLSSGFPIEGKPFGSTGYDGLAATSSGQKLPMQDKTDKELETARIAIYPLDVRGAAVADIAGETNADTGGDCAKCQVVNAEKDSDLRTGQRSEMLEIAHATGGVARFNNDLTESLLQGFRQGESYYTISYTPQDAMWDGRYHQFKLNLDKPGAQMLYRQGYFAKDVQPEAAPTAEQFRAALEPNAPTATSVLFAVNVFPSGDSAEVQYAIDPSTVQFVSGSDGRLLADLDCAILEFSAKNKVLEKSLIRLSETTGDNQSPQSRATALNAKQTIALKSGAATLIVGVRDRATGLFGTLEVSLPTH